VITSKYPWRDSEGEVVGTFGVSSDISDLMQAQSDLRKLAATYERKNGEMAEELELAREVQQALLPDEFPKISGGGATMNFCRLYEPAHLLTGEFFEVLPLAPDRVGFLMGEVFDRGVRSALIVSMLRGLIEKEIASAGDAGEFLTGINVGLSHLLLNSGHETKATAFYGLVDLTKGEIQLSIAGHVNPMAVFDDGVRQLVPPAYACGPALGVAENSSYGTVSAPLTGLRRLICFTEGFQNTNNVEGKEFGVTRMLEEVERGGDLDRVMERLAEAVKDFGGHQEFENAICLLGWEITR
jgi:sigma-B regulation protein RsbU (phosphoserine phosphatase)